MENCLGIYIGKNTVKYAKIAKIDNLDKIKVLSCGLKYATEDKITAITNIVSETGSDGMPIILNLQNEKYHSLDVLKQINKQDLASLIDLEAYEFIGKEDPNVITSTVKYKYYLSDSIKSTDNYEATMIFMEKKELQKYIDNAQLSIRSVYPISYVIDNLVDDKVQNYAIITINEATSITIVNDKKIRTVLQLNLGMDKIMTEIPKILGSYEKAYEACKVVNVYSDENSNDPEIEAVIEPVLQDILNRIQSKLKELKLPIDKIYLNGMINSFINIDVLFEQYFEKKTEKLRPKFVDKDDPAVNMQEVIEANEAFSLAYEYFHPTKEDLDFFATTTKSNSNFQIKDFFNNKIKPFFDKNFKKNTMPTAQPKNKGTPKGKPLFTNKGIVIGDFKLVALIPILAFADAVIVVLIVAYGLFSHLYANQVVINTINLQEEQALIKQDIDAMKLDETTISTSQSKYDEYNAYVNDALSKITNGEIGKYSTYNVAMFMLKVSKYIPEGVILKSITSNATKNIEMIADSDSYAQLGYLISQLKLQRILENVITSTVVHGETITVTIGGDLP